jgi:hypothetical protein
MQAAVPQTRVYWFDDIEQKPWVARDTHAITGAVERMRSTGSEVCFFIAWDINHVRVLNLKQRALEKQTQQFLVV